MYVKLFIALIVIATKQTNEVIVAIQRNILFLRKRVVQTYREKVNVDISEKVNDFWFFMFMFLNDSWRVILIQWRWISSTFFAVILFFLHNPGLPIIFRSNDVALD